MAQPKPMTIPLINPNEREAVITGLFIQELESVFAGEVLATIESTKTNLEIVSDRDGFVIGLTKKVGDTVLTGEVLCFIAQNREDPIPGLSVPNVSTRKEITDIQGLIISQPALNLAKEAGLDLNILPKNQFITTTVVKSFLHQKGSIPQIIPSSENSIVLYGGGGHGKSLIELIRAEGQYQLAGIVDDGLAEGDSVLEIAVIGHSEKLVAIRSTGITNAINGVGGIGNLASRLRVFELLTNAGFSFPSIFHPRAYIEKSAITSDGVQVFAMAYIGSCTKVGFGCIINTGAILSHDCMVGNYSNISPGAVLAGNVEVEEQVLIGMGVTINLNVHVGAGARIGNGATVKANVPGGIVVKAGSIWPL